MPVNACSAMAALPRIAASGRVDWRPMRSEDAGYVAALEAHIHAAPWTAGNFRDALAAGYAAQVAERDGRIVAYGVMMVAPGEAQILNVSVVPDARHEGLGRALVSRFIAAAARVGAEQAFLEVRVSNAPAIALYESTGFAHIARRADYYPAGPDGKREDALVMRKELR